MYILKVMIPAIISIISVLKVDNITYKRNLHDPLGITEPLTNYRMSYQYSTTNINYTKTTLSHKEIINEGSIKNIKNRDKNNNQKKIYNKKNHNKNKNKNHNGVHLSTKTLTYLNYKN